MLTKIICLGVGLMMLSGCATNLMSPVPGVLYTEVKGPLLVVSNSGKSKVGTAVSESYLGLIATGDASIEAAVWNAKITKINHVDYGYYSFIGLYSKYTIYVYGE